MPLVAAAVLPHGDFAFDPSLLSNPTSRAAADGLHRGSLLAGRLLADAAPDAIVLTTPHGLQTSWDVGIYQNAALQGVATVGRDLQESFGPASPRKLYPVSLDGQTDAGLAQQIMDVLSARHNVTLQRGWNGVLPMPLHWGEVLALSYVANASAAHCLPPLVTLGLPLSRYNLSSAVATGFLQLGRDLGRLLEASSKRVALLVSTDLAHTHWRNTSFGFSPHAAPFDAALGTWAARLDAGALLRGSAALVDQVYSCGWLGLPMLHGALEAAAEAEVRKAGQGGKWSPLNASWAATLTAAPAHPTYYGMMAAVFQRRRRDAFVCPANTHRCADGCAPVEAGAAVCCGDGTACASGYRCADRPSFGPACVRARGDREAAPEFIPEAAPGPRPEPVPVLAAAEAPGAAVPLPMGTAGWELRYHLCRAGALPLHRLALPAAPPGQPLLFPYYSNLGPVGHHAAASAEVALIVQHGSGRNADDYFCSGVQAAAMAGLGGGRALVLAPRFMEPADGPPPSVVWWNGTFPEGCWRCGAESDPRASRDGRSTVSSFAVLDALLDALGAAKTSGALPSLRRVVLAGHSSGGQIVQRHAIFSRVPPRPQPFAVRHVAANPSSYAYFGPERWRGGRLALPDAAARVRCPDYDSWHWGLASRLPPFAASTPGGTNAALALFAARDVVYLQGRNDTCDCNPTTAGCGCLSHGLETTCADELMGRFRLMRGRLYYAQLQAHFNASPAVHSMVEVPNVGHDHTLMWQSTQGLDAIFRW